MRGMAQHALPLANRSMNFLAGDRLQHLFVTGKTDRVNIVYQLIGFLYNVALGTIGLCPLGMGRNLFASSSSTVGS